MMEVLTPAIRKTSTCPTSFIPAASDPNYTLDCDEPEKATKENSNYRTVAWTGRYLQLP